MNKNMTALVSAFARLYHTKNSNIKIYNDMYAEKIITEDEYYEISTNMKNYDLDQEIVGLIMTSDLFFKNVKYCSRVIVLILLYESSQI